MYRWNFTIDPVHRRKMFSFVNLLLSWAQGYRYSCISPRQTRTRGFYVPIHVPGACVEMKKCHFFAGTWSPCCTGQHVLFWWWCYNHLLLSSFPSPCLKVSCRDLGVGLQKVEGGEVTWGSCDYYFHHQVLLSSVLLGDPPGSLGLGKGSWHWRSDHLGYFLSHCKALMECVQTLKCFWAKLGLFLHVLLIHSGGAIAQSSFTWGRYDTQSP